VAYGENRGADVIRQFLAAEWKIDADTVLRPVAGLLHDAQQRASDALFNLFAALSTTWRTSPRHQRFLGFLMVQSHPPAFFADAIFSRMMDRPFST
jgi:hypothetical protein